jgi:hypothetical protein
MPKGRLRYGRICCSGRTGLEYWQPRRHGCREVKGLVALAEFLKTRRCALAFLAICTFVLLPSPASATTATSSSTATDAVPTTTELPRASASCKPPPLSAYDKDVLASRPWIFYRLDDGPGKAIIDTASPPHNGTYALTGVEHCAPGPILGGTAVYVPKPTLGIGTGGPGLTGNGSFTLEAWFNSTGLRQDEALLSMGGGNEVGLAVWSNYPNVAFSTLTLDEHGVSNVWDTRTARVDIWDGRWHYLVISYNAATGFVTGYADAHDLGAQKLARAAMGLLAGPVLLGNWVDHYVNSPFVGEAADLAIYPHTTAPAEVAARYAAAGYPRPSQPKPPGVVSSISSALVPPAKAFSPLTTDVVNLTIAVGAALFITFPANLFNSTFQENYADISAWWAKWWGRALPARLRQRLRRTWAAAKSALLRLLRLSGTSRAKRLERREATFAGVVLAGALLGSLLDPRFGFNVRTLTSYAAIVLALVAGVAVSGTVTGWYHRLRGRRGTKFKFEALPVGLVVAGFCVLVSRATNFAPGYLYGVIAGVTFARELPPNEEGHLAGLRSAANIAVALAAWGCWTALHGYASRKGTFFGAVVADDFLASLFVSNLVGTVISLFPLRFLPGYKLKSWHSGAWAATFALSFFVLVQVLLRPRSGGGPSHAPLVTTICLFVVFGLGSLLFRAHFARKHRAGPALAAPAGSGGARTTAETVARSDEPAG